MCFTLMIVTIVTYDTMSGLEFQNSIARLLNNNYKVGTQYQNYYTVQIITVERIVWI